jgi:ATP-binding cassette subfamily B protein
MVALAVPLFAGIALQLAGPQAVRYFIDTAQSEGSLTSLYIAASLFVVVMLVGQAFNALSTYIGRDVAWRATNRMRSDLLLHVLRLDMSFHTDHTPGELVERIDTDVDKLANFFSKFAVRLVGGMLVAAGALVLLGLEDWRIGLAITVFVLTFLTLHTYGQSRTRPYWRTLRRASADLASFVGERYPGTKDIQKSGAESYAITGFHDVVAVWFRTYLKAMLTTVVAWIGTFAWLRSGNVIAIGVAGALFLAGDITVGTVYMVFHYMRMIVGPLLAISEEVRDLQQARAAIDRIDALFDERAEILGGCETVPSGQLSLEFNRVSFAYLADRPVLKDVSFRLEPGRKLGVLGRTGSGKTTLSRLVFRLYDANEGAILLGERDVGAMQMDDLRHRVGMVTQDVQLFNATLRDNLTLFDEAVDDRQLVGTLDSVGLSRWYGSLPSGLDTLLYPGGEGLSAGEAQLLASTRVFLHDPGLVILDEASSRLDPGTEQLLEEAVTRLLEGRTAIIIAHRLATLARVDDILIVDEGAVVEYGPQRDLATSPDSRYGALLRTGMEEVLA